MCAKWYGLVRNKLCYRLCNSNPKPPARKSGTRLLEKFVLWFSMDVSVLHGFVPIVENKLRYMRTHDNNLNLLSELILSICSCAQTLAR